MIKWIKENVPFAYEVDGFLKKIVLILLKRKLKKYDRKRNSDVGV